jgi:hypothetical protein
MPHQRMSGKLPQPFLGVLNGVEVMPWPKSWRIRQLFPTPLEGRQTPEGLLKYTK